MSSTERTRASRGSTQTRTTTTTSPRKANVSPPQQTRRERTATVNLPFVTATFRAPDIRLPGREELNSAARRAGSLLPSGKAALYYGGLAATAVAGIIEWPIAAAIGVGTALASRGEARPEPREKTGTSTASSR